jgi:hypothetical protein
LSAILALTRYALRNRRRSILVYVALIAVFGGVVLAAATGARRTGSAMDRFLDYNAATDVEVTGVDFDRLRSLPEVADAGQGVFYWMVPVDAAGRADSRAESAINPFGAVAANGGNRRLVIRGRVPQPGQPLEVVVNEALAEHRQLVPGDKVTMRAYAADQQDAAFRPPAPAPHGPTFTFTVTGVVREPADLAPAAQADVTYLGTGQNLTLTPAFWRAYGGQVANLSDGAASAVRLRPGVSNAQFLVALRQVPGGEDAKIGSDGDSARVVAQARDAIQVEAMSLWAFAAITALAGLLLVGQGLDRLTRDLAGRQQSLRAVGLTRRQLVAAELACGLVVATLGASVALVLAVALTPLTPIGLARRAEITPGVRVDLPVLLVGWIGLVVLLVAQVAVAVWAVTREPQSRRAGAPVTAHASAPALISGLTAWRARALLLRGAQGSRRRAAATRWGVVCAVALATASLALTGDLRTLARSPSDQGWTWDVAVGNPHSGDDITEHLPLLARNPQVAAYTPAAFTLPVPVDQPGPALPLLALGPGHGGIGLRILAGTTPRAEDEIALGRATLKRMRRAVGDTVHLQAADGQWRTFRVVGQVLMPGQFGADFTMSTGGLVTSEGLRALQPEAVASQALVRYAADADQRRAYASLQHDFGDTVLKAATTPEVANLQRVGNLPSLLAALVSIIALAVLAHTILLAVRGGRRHIAVLKALGFLRRHVTSTIVGHAAGTAAWAFLIGIPVGVLLGRWGWLLLNAQLGSVAGPVIPWLALTLLAILTPMSIALVIYLPARRASGLSPAGALRGE